MTDFLTERYVTLGRAYDQMMATASIERCNCMVRYADGMQMPAIRLGRSKRFLDPEGRL